MLKKSAIILLTCLIGIDAHAADLLRCISPGQGDVVISFDLTRLRQKVDCISGDFISDLEACAPDGGWGLSAPTGSAALTKIVRHWQDYGDHTGGVVSHFISKSEIVFEGGFIFPGSGPTTDWNFTANRITGEGVLRRNKRPPVRYSCAVVAQKF